MDLKQHRSVWVAALALTGLLASLKSPAFAADSIGTAKAADGRSGASSDDVKKHVEGVARRIFAIADVVLDHHIEPATRQEMILAGLRAVFAWKNLPAPELSRRVSDLRTVEELTGLLNELWPKFTHNGEASADGAEKALFEGLLRPVAGSPYILRTKDARVQTQIAANRYVGIGIALSADEKKTELPKITMVQPGGPAQLGGVKAGDLIEEIDKSPVKPGTQLVDVVDRLRGAEGTEVTVRVRQPDAKEPRTLTLKRLPVMFKSVKNSESKEDSEHVNFVHSQPTIAYLRIDSITASTASELASWEPRLRGAGVKGLILDFRNTGGSGGFDSYHAALLLADSLLDGKPLGKLRTRDGVRTFAADRDCLFRDWPLAVLVNQNTSGPAQWVVAALQDADPPKQDRRRAVVVGNGNVTRGDCYVRSAYLLPGGEESLVLATGAWERPNVGRSAPKSPKDNPLEWHLAADIDYEQLSPDAAPAGTIQLTGPDPVNTVIAPGKGNLVYPMADPTQAAARPKIVQPVTRATVPASAMGQLEEQAAPVDRPYKAAVKIILGQIDLAAKSSK